MISKKIVTPIIDKIIASGGTKKYVANLLEVDDYLKNIKQTDTLKKIVKRVLTRSNKQLRTILSKIKLDTKEIIQKGNNGFRTKLVYGLAYGLCNDTDYIEDNNTSINIKI